MILLSFFERKIFKNNRKDISDYENEILSLKDDNNGNLKEKLASLYKKTYSFATFINVKKMILIFLIIVISLIYCAFTGNISLNFVLFHAFIYYYLSQNVGKIIECLESYNQKRYYLSLYQYYCN